MKAVLLGGLMALLTGTAALAADSKGRFYAGGGVGSVLCADFLNSLATARQEGGISSLDGARRMQGYSMFVAGFQTAFNAQTPGVFNVFGDFGEEPTARVIYAVEPWCQQHPEERFGSGVLNLARKMARAKGN